MSVPVLWRGTVRRIDDQGVWVEVKRRARGRLFRCTEDLELPGASTTATLGDLAHAHDTVRGYAVDDDVWVAPIEGDVDRLAILGRRRRLV